MNISVGCILRTAFVLGLQHIMHMKKSTACTAFVWGTIIVIMYTSFQHHQCAKYQTSEKSLYSNHSTIRQCITGDIIGVRPLVTTVSFSNLAYCNNTENNEKRKTAFQNIFEKKIWGRNKDVNFSGSGKQRFFTQKTLIKPLCLKCNKFFRYTLNAELHLAPTKMLL